MRWAARALVLVGALHGVSCGAASSGSSDDAGWASDRENDSADGSEGVGFDDAADGRTLDPDAPEVDAGNDRDASSDGSPDEPVKVDGSRDAPHDESVVVDGALDATVIDGADAPDTATTGCLGQGVGCDQAVQIAGGVAHACALLTTGHVRCWGSNSDGQLGRGTLGGLRFKPTEVLGVSGVVRLAASDHTCAILKDKTISCWGKNTDGQLGDGTKTSRGTPEPVTGLTDVAEVAVSGTHTCALLDGGTVKCWGANANGQLGDGLGVSQLRPSPVPNLTGVVRLAAGSSGFGSTCAVLGNGDLACWGRNDRGQLGDGTTSDRPTPNVSMWLHDVDTVGIGSGHACALDKKGGVHCWGANDVGQLGNDTKVPSNYPIALTSPAMPRSLWVAADGSCVVTAAHDALCWGGNGSGQLGDGSLTSRGAAKIVNAIEGLVDSVGPGDLFNCAVLVDGDARCWGYNFYGELGDGTDTDRYLPWRLAW